MELINALMAVFRKGYEVKHAEEAKKAQAISGFITAVLLLFVAFLHVAGVNVTVDSDSAVALGAGLGSVYMSIMSIITIVSTKRIGFGKVPVPIDSHDAQPAVADGSGAVPADRVERVSRGTPDRDADAELPVVEPTLDWLHPKG